MGAGTPVERRHSRLTHCPAAHRGVRHRLPCDCIGKSASASRCHSPNALHSAGNNCLAAVRSRPPTGGTCRRRTAASGAWRNSGVGQIGRTAPPHRPPPARQRPGARARRSPRVRATVRSGCGIAVMTPKSDTCPPRRRRRWPAGVGPRRRADEPTVGAVQGGDVVGADHDDRRIRRRPGHEHGVDLAGQALRRGADDRLVLKPDPLARFLGQPRAINTPGTSSAVRLPYPVAVESPKIIRCRLNGTSAVPLLDGPPRGVDAVGPGRDVPGLRDDRRAWSAWPFRRFRAPTYAEPVDASVAAAARAMVDRRGARIPTPPV